LVHKSRWNSVKLAYLFCRYYPLFVYPVYMWVWLGDHAFEFCSKISHPLYAFVVPFQLSAQAVILIRAHAFTGRNTLTLIFLSSCYLALFAAEIWLFSGKLTVASPLFLLLGKSGCFADDPRLKEAGASFATANRTALVLLGAFFLDLITMALVIVHCIRIRSTQGRLGRAFLRQGLGAFVAMSVLNLLSASFYLLPSIELNGIGIPITMICPNVIACRLILKLRRRVLPTASVELDVQSRLVRGAVDAMDLQESIEHEFHVEELTRTWTID
jgi:hypothetical protein